MKKRTINLFLLAAMATACSQPPQSNTPIAGRSDVNHSKMDHSDHANMRSSTGASEAPYDLQFLDTMIAHHQGAIEMAQLAGSRAQHEEIRQLAGQITSGQQAEIEKMKSWRTKWFADAPQSLNAEFPGMKEGMAGMDLSKLDMLKSNAFDQEFMRQMIPHHEGALTMAKDALSKGGNAEIKELARQIIEDQEAEIAKMKKWQEAWK